MTATRRRLLEMAGVAALASLLPQESRADEYPTRPIHFIIPFAAGGGVDLVARLIGEKMGAELKQPVIVENRVGGGGILGADVVAKSAPDGYTVLVTTSGHTILPNLEKLPWDPVKDFQPVGEVISYPLMLVVNPSVPAKTLSEFIALAKTKPGALNYGTGGVGTPPQLAMEMLKSMAGIDLVHIAYRGNGPATIALLAGEIQVMFDTMIGPLPYVREGKLRALAVSSKSRFPTVPDIPTVSEAGLPGFEFEGWTGMFAPAQTPKPIVQKVSAALSKVVNDPVIINRLAGLGYRAVGDTPDDFAKTVSADLSKIGKIVKDAHIKVKQ